jgi:DNA-binding transcriptional regulator YhcF (GntR family)
MEMCEQDSTMCNDMANMMSVHPHMMQMCVQRMKENGMMDSNGKIKMMDSDIPMERSTQHGHQ